MEELKQKGTRQISIYRTWDRETVEAMISVNDWFDKGHVRDYRDLMNFIEDHDPTIENILIVAERICINSDELRNDSESVELVMREIENHIVETDFNVSRWVPENHSKDKEMLCGDSLPFMESED